MVTQLARKIAEPQFNAKPIVEMTIFFSETLSRQEKGNQPEYDLKQVPDEALAKYPL